MADAEGVILPPSPNWYCSSAADCSVNGVYAFAAKSHVFLLDINSEPPSVRGQFSEHGERVSGVGCSSRATKLFASASDDKTVKIWDMNDKTVLASHNAHHVSGFENIYRRECMVWY